jgi:hypothetical protein
VGSVAGEERAELAATRYDGVEELSIWEAAARLRPVSHRSSLCIALPVNEVQGWLLLFCKLCCEESWNNAEEDAVLIPIPVRGGVHGPSSGVSANVPRRNA